MSNINLGILKKSIYQTYFSDGIWDMILGLVYLSFGLGVLINQIFWYLFPIIVTLPLVLKRSVSDPRMGSLKFKKSQRIWLGAFHFLFLGLVTGFVILLGVLNPSGDVLVRWLTVNIFLVIGLILSIILSLVGCFVNFQRMYLYAVLNLIGFALIGRITSAGVVFTMLGLIILIFGIIVLRNFIKHHPKVSLQDETG